MMCAESLTRSLYERLGGIYAIATVVDDFIDSIMIDPALNANPLGRPLRSSCFWGSNSSIRAELRICRSLKVGDRTLENVTGSIAPVDGSLLLGQSFLRRFKSWSIDNQREALILN
jgi:hypothetical protein